MIAAIFSFIYIRGLTITTFGIPNIAHFNYLLIGILGIAAGFVVLSFGTLGQYFNYGRPSGLLLSILALSISVAGIVYSFLVFTNNPIIIDLDLPFGIITAPIGFISAIVAAYLLFYGAFLVLSRDDHGSDNITLVTASLSPVAPVIPYFLPIAFTMIAIYFVTARMPTIEIPKHPI